MEELGRLVKRTLAQKNTIASIPASPEKEESEGPQCPVCKGRGWVVLDVPADHPDFEKSFPCRCRLVEMASGQVDRLKQFSNLGPLVRLTFENLDPKGLSPEPKNQKCFEASCEVARSYAADPDGWLVLTGPSGCGKTHMAAAIANACISCGIPVFWTIVPDLLDYLRGTFSPQSEVAYDDLFEKVKNAKLLILDDLGTHSSTPWAEEKLFQVINHRFNAQLPTVVTTIDIDGLDERLQTRLRHTSLSQVFALKVEVMPLLSDFSGLSRDVISSMSFANFDVQGMNADREERGSLKNAFDTARHFADTLPDEWLVLVGPEGSGKTHLAAAVANRQIDAGRSVFFASVPELLDRLRSAFNSDLRKTKEPVLGIIQSTRLLVLDDFGVETATPWAREKLYQILNYRYNAKLPTMITMNYPVMENLDPRLASRLRDARICTFVPFVAPDYRGQGDKAASKTRKRSPRKP